MKIKVSNTQQPSRESSCCRDIVSRLGSEPLLVPRAAFTSTCHPAPDPRAEKAAAHRDLSSASRQSGHRGGRRLVKECSMASIMQEA